MKLEITGIDALCIAQLFECMHLVTEPEFYSFRKRILSALRDAGYRPLTEDEVMLPIKVENNV